MRIRLTPRTGLAAIAAIGLLLPFGAPLPGSCVRTVGVAGAAPTPSPSCGGDLRECLRLSADMHQTTFGGRYVTADDVARCTDAFRACSSGGASRGGSASPPESTGSAGNERKALPERLGVYYEDKLAMDCRVNGDSVTCTDAPVDLPLAMDSRTGTITGQLSGMTLNGTRTIRTQSHYLAEPGCIEVGEGTAPVKYVFNPDGTVAISEGPFSWQTTRSGSCAGSDSRTNPVIESTATWAGIP